jgi:2-methylisocitrate lyase-like PEP mutase family enzyme
MASDLNATAKAFRALHIPGKPLTLANVHDAAAAELVASHPSCAALATASFSVALANGTEDAKLTLETQLAAAAPIAAVARAHSLPLTVDLQDGYGARLEEAVAAVIAAGAVGINLEDSVTDGGAMMGEEEAVSRVARAVAAARAAGVPDFVVNARSDTFWRTGDLAAAIARGKKYLAAGATTVYIVGHNGRECTADEIADMVAGLGGMVNLGMALPKPGKEPALKRADFVKAGIARVSIGPQLYFVPEDKRAEMAAYVMG